ncbi:hypothetical protein THASP1DRAFT_29909 [Thamnocephalis sphaerospora]|uniref:Ser-Thr-rich glycosyl-phosphatidyl-inositol-anchored membrane family-domain-containing protein n=1 Tax=Thamnocephalis sphaerospora TaxID=78915 RepID=A0A4P9XQG0_9FUNG|nr:hypothetical protein THASP1DRAFT_29909 [Thamnocephalis sphaerospora]|eukprot:RKP08277.1 hypothetical protein THASP1DRAFT_29909 [Thamnocephalis sphaerospora]
MKVTIANRPTAMRLVSVLFAFIALFCTQLASAQTARDARNIVSITSPSVVAAGKTQVTWEVPESKQNSFFTFDVELWASSSNGRMPALDVKVATLGQTRTGAAGNRANKYTLDADIPSLPNAKFTTYYVAVYGRELVHGPTFTSQHPWDTIYYDLKPVKQA